MRRLIVSMLLLSVAQVCSGVAQAPVMSRNVDKRPLIRVPSTALSPVMKRTLSALIKQTKEDSGADGVTSGSLEVRVYSIPVAQPSHKLYLVKMSGQMACSSNGPNCSLIVFDERPSGVTTVVDDSGTGVDVVRTSTLALPDIAFHVQEGQFATSTVVYRFSERDGWHVHLCKEIEPINSDPNPAILADKPCTQ